MRDSVKVSSLLANIFSGILIVLIVDALIYSMHLKNIMPMKSAGELIFSSNFIAAVINIAGSLIYLAYDAKFRGIIEGTIADTPFDKGKLIIDSVKALGNMPFLNLGLVVFVSCWFVFLAARKYINK